ncbi:hypothetical protein AB0436_29535 [Streptomyces sp. NPDC051322]|uniref:hypothetical protein n=1 Tax=Streptomyces sp. NPDC051322 TaxID=3154645 RepID=UPI00344BC994
MISTIRSEVNSSICCGIHDRMSLAEQAGMLRLLEERGSDGTTQFKRLKQTAQGPSWSHFKRLFTHLEWLDKLGDTAVWVDGAPSAKVTDFAGFRGAAALGEAVGAGGQGPGAGAHADGDRGPYRVLGVALLRCAYRRKITRPGTLSGSHVP